MIKTDILDVTRIEPRLKHPTIFSHFDALEAGEAFTISNDHDPRPLYYQLLGERGNIFTWEYLESGPQRWQVRIAKNGKREETVGEIAAKDIRKADAFKKLGIDFCCGGRKTVSEALAEAGISREQYEAELEKVANRQIGGVAHNFDSWGLGFLSDYIFNVHHQYIRENGPILEQLAEKVAHRHGGQHPELNDLVGVVQNLMAELYSHIQKEEQILFPLIKQFEQQGAKPQMGVDGPIARMEAEHEDAGNELRTLRKLTSDYTLPIGACNSYTYLFQKLEEFESDLFQHIHLENNILFPKAIEMEKAMMAV
ncbi:MAG TPA: iron-sulfur cluster repair di-iron protein [Sphingobacteriaceae bacterium]|nr:iron-sulfur cluster repair di-iron protein [Sphingobacteriaceae bacterium]